MKYKHTITIADIQMNIITEEAPEAVEAMVGVLDRRMREIFLKSENRCPKIEAALLCALDYCAERNKLQETVNRMEEERRGVDIPAVLAELAELKNDNEKLTMQLTYTEDQARTMKSGIDIANDQIRILKTQVDDAEAKAAEAINELENAKKLSDTNAELEERIAELEAALAEKNAECDVLSSKLEKAEEKEDEEEISVEVTVEDADDLNMMIDEVVEEAIEETSVVAEAVVEEIVEEVTEEKTEEKSEEPVKRPVAEIADNIIDSFELDMKPLRRGNIDENQLTIDSELKDGEDKPAEQNSVEKEKQKAHKRVRSMFDLITFDNV